LLLLAYFSYHTFLNLETNTMEHSFIAWAKQRVSKLSQPEVGIGDDAAVLRASNRSRVVTTDSLCEGSHFVLTECGPRAVGRKLAGVNLSDLAAMAAAPTDMFVSACLTKLAKKAQSSGDDDLSPSRIAVEIFEGIVEYAEKFGVSISGGDTNLWDGPLVVSMTAIGEAPEGGCWLRSGAKPGDHVVVTGELGGSILGRHLNVEPRIELAKLLRQEFNIHAATDISDGLGVDLLSLFNASRCGAEIELGKIPISDAARTLAVRSGRMAVDHALGDGEDFELLLAIPDSEMQRLPPELAGVRLTSIGRFVSRTGLWQRDGGKVRQLAPKGYVHGTSS
jgi:thiamine-monophosphate kinase